MCSAERTPRRAQGGPRLATQPAVHVREQEQTRAWKQERAWLCAHVGQQPWSTRLQERRTVVVSAGPWASLSSLFCRRLSLARGFHCVSLLLSLFLSVCLPCHKKKEKKSGREEKERGKKREKRHRSDREERTEVTKSEKKRRNERADEKGQKTEGRRYRERKQKRRGERETARGREFVVCGVCGKRVNYHSTCGRQRVTTQRERKLVVIY